jgi:hypothetical protein
MRLAQSARIYDVNIIYMQGNLITVMLCCRWPYRWRDVVTCLALQDEACARVDCKFADVKVHKKF